MTKKALITGVSGQDGRYLADLLLKKGYQVYGLVRRESIESLDNTHLKNDIQIVLGNLESFPTLYSLLKKVQPDEIYHFAAQSFVSFSFQDEFATMNTNAMGTHYLLSSVYDICPQCRVYFAGSSEMFGNAQSYPQNEETAFRPRSIYGISKLVGYELVRNYRDQKNLYACTGILYNHESPLRGDQFVTQKIVKTAVKIKKGLTDKIVLGNIDAKRDWGHAEDYVKAIYKMLQQDVPEDFVIGTGQLHSVREFLSIVFEELGLDYEKYLVIDEKLIRPSEKIPLVADASKAHEKLNWRPEKSFEEIALEMLRSALN